MVPSSGIEVSIKNTIFHFLLRRSKCFPGHSTESCSSFCSLSPIEYVAQQYKTRVDDFVLLSCILFISMQDCNDFRNEGA